MNMYAGGINGVNVWEILGWRNVQGNILDPTYLLLELTVILCLKACSLTL